MPTDWCLVRPLFLICRWLPSHCAFTQPFLCAQTAVFGASSSSYKDSIYTTMHKMGFPAGASGKEPVCQCRRHKRCRFNSWVGKIPWERAWQPTLVFLPGESHGQGSLAGYSSQGRKESDITERLHTHSTSIVLGFSGGGSYKEPDRQCSRHKRHRFDPWFV